jgi:hypothetical protein
MQVDILDPRNGAVCGTCEVGSTDPSQSVNGRRPDNDPIIGLHVFRKDRSKLISFNLAFSRLEIFFLFSAVRILF